MKYLKKFESNDDELQFGVTPDDIRYLFTDISDNGWKLDVRFLKKFFDFRTFNDSDDDQEDLKFGLIPYIQVSISKPTAFEDRFKRSKWHESKELNVFTTSDEFKEIIEVASLRLDELGLYINKKGQPDHNRIGENIQFNIFIYRKTDENYIK